MQTEQIKLLAKQAESDLDGVISNPIWRRIYDEEPDFAAHLPAEFKLELLRYIYGRWSGFEIPDRCIAQEAEEEDDDLVDEPDPYYFEEILCDIMVDIDPWKTAYPGVIYSATGNATRLEEVVELESGWTAAFFFEEPDLAMKDVNEGCDQRFSLASLLPIYFETPDQDIREAAQSCDIYYEPAMSPVDGGYFRLSMLTLWREGDAAIEIEADSDMEEYFERDVALAGWIKESTGHALSLFQLKEHGCEEILSKPVFENGPRAKNIDSLTFYEPFSWCSESGVINVEWCCRYWVPNITLLEAHSLGEGDLLTYHRKELSAKFSAYGEASFDYEINYRYSAVSELECAILQVLGSKTSSMLSGLYLHALGLNNLRASQGLESI